MSLFSSQPLGHLLLPQDFSHPLFRVKYQLLINDWQTVLWTCNIFDKERYPLTINWPNNHVYPQTSIKYFCNLADHIARS